MNARVSLLVASCAVLAAASSVLLWALPSQAAPSGVSSVDPQVVMWGLVAAAAVTGVASIAAGYAVAKVGTAAAGTVVEKPELFGRMLVLVGLAEGIAIYGLIVSILILNLVG